MPNEIEPNTSDTGTLERLNKEYVEAFMTADVNWYQEHLAEDLGLLVALVVPDHWQSLLGEVADGIALVVRESGARIIGGNLSRGDVFGITTTVIGSAKRIVSRRGAMPGDVLVVTGTLGGPGSAIRAWDANEAPSPWGRMRFANPAPRLAEGEALASAGAHAMMDVSDGLAADTRHLAAASGMRIEIDASRVPMGAGIDWRTALYSGEEYELLAALPPHTAQQTLHEWPSRFSVPLTAIGTVLAVDATGSVSIAGVNELADFGKKATGRVEFESGYDHFSR